MFLIKQKTTEMFSKYQDFWKQKQSFWNSQKSDKLENKGKVWTWFMLLKNELDCILVLKCPF